MKYRIEEYKLKNGIEDISIIFDEKYQLLTTFMSCDVLPFLITDRSSSNNCYFWTFRIYVK